MKMTFSELSAALDKAVSDIDTKKKISDDANTAAAKAIADLDAARANAGKLRADFESLMSEKFGSGSSRIR